MEEGFWEGEVLKKNLVDASALWILSWSSSLFSYNTFAIALSPAAFPPRSLIIILPIFFFRFFLQLKENSCLQILVALPSNRETFAFPVDPLTFLSSAKHISIIPPCKGNSITYVRIRMEYNNPAVTLKTYITTTSCAPLGQAFREYKIDIPTRQRGVGLVLGRYHTNITKFK